MNVKKLQSINITMGPTYNKKLERPKQHGILMLKTQSYPP